MTVRSPSSKRKYNSSRRKAQADETRRQIVEAARMMFLERGYSGTTIEAIARTAGVAQETVYSTFKNKYMILHYLFNISIGGDERRIRVIDRPEPQAILQETDARRQLALFAENMTEILSRAEPILEIMRSAAKTETEIAGLFRRFLKERLKNMKIVAGHVAANGPLRNTMDPDAAGELICSMTSPELYQLLTNDLGWSKKKFEAWLADVLTILLLP